MAGVVDVRAGRRGEGLFVKVAGGVGAGGGLEARGVCVVDVLRWDGLWVLGCRRGEAVVESLEER